jgi:quinohemoprotein ethanol dehydrogenase
MQASKNGFFYILDRLTGELLSAEHYAQVTWASRIDLKSGRPIENPGARYPNGTTTGIWPSGWGAHGASSMSYSPKTHLAYIPVMEMGSRLNVRGIDVKNWHPPAGPNVPTG